MESEELRTARREYIAAQLFVNKLELYRQRHPEAYRAAERELREAERRLNVAKGYVLK